MKKKNIANLVFYLIIIYQFLGFLKIPPIQNRLARISAPIDKFNDFLNLTNGEQLFMAHLPDIKQTNFCIRVRDLENDSIIYQTPKEKCHLSHFDFKMFFNAKDYISIRSVLLPLYLYHWHFLASYRNDHFQTIKFHEAFWKKLLQGKFEDFFPYEIPKASLDFMENIQERMKSLASLHCSGHSEKTYKTISIDIVYDNFSFNERRPYQFQGTVIQYDCLEDNVIIDKSWEFKKFEF